MCETLHAEGHARGQAAAATRGAAAEAEAAAACDSLQASFDLFSEEPDPCGTWSIQYLRLHE